MRGIELVAKLVMNAFTQVKSYLNIHLFNFIIYALHELFQHEFSLNFLFILIPKKHSFAISLFWLNPLKYIIQKHFPFLLAASLSLNNVVKFFEMSSFSHSHFDFNVQTCDVVDYKLEYFAFGFAAYFCIQQWC